MENYLIHIMVHPLPFSSSSFVWFENTHKGNKKAVITSYMKQVLLKGNDPGNLRHIIYTLINFVCFCH